MTQRWLHAYLERNILEMTTRIKYFESEEAKFIERHFNVFEADFLHNQKLPPLVQQVLEELD